MAGRQGPEFERRSRTSSSTFPLERLGKSEASQAENILEVCDMEGVLGPGCTQGQRCIALTPLTLQVGPAYANRLSCSKKAGNSCLPVSTAHPYTLAVNYFKG